LIHFLHDFAVNQDQDDENVDGSLLSEPKAQGEASQLYGIKRLHQQNAQDVGNKGPYG
jgi:hypothetical protein